MWGDEASFAAVLVGGADGALAEAVTLAGGRVTATLGWDAPLLAEAGALVLLDTAGIDAALLDAALPTVAGRADVVSCEPDQLDAVAGALLFTDAQFLCAPTMADRVAAVAVAAGLAGRDTAPMVREGEAARLKRFGGEVARIAAVLARLAEEEAASTVAERSMAFAAAPAAAPADAAVDARAVRAVIRARRARDGFFGAGLFEDPAWDMLLDLFAAELEGAQVSVSSLCIAAAVAPTTALRWLNRLLDHGLLERRPDPQDRRRAFVALSARAGAAMRGYWAAVPRQGLSPG